MVCEYGQSLERGTMVLIASLAGDPLGREMFELWHYDGPYSFPDGVEKYLFVPWSDDPLFHDLHGTEVYLMAEELVHAGMVRKYLQLSICVVAEDYFHGQRVVLCRPD